MLETDKDGKATDSSVPFRMRNRVVFPAPDGPMTERNSPSPRVKLTSRSTSPER